MNAICQNCGSDQTHLYETHDENRRCTNEVFHWLHCARCGLISLGNPPEDLGQYYDGGYYRIPTPDRLKRLSANENAKVAAIVPYLPGGRLLEIGPAVGVFSRRASLEGFEVTVIERDERCCDHLRSFGDMTVVHADDPVVAMQDLPQFDVIVLWHVIEHLREPFSFLRSASEKLRPGGLLVFACPNPDSWQFSVMGKRWPHLDAPRHLHIIPAKVAISHCHDLGLELVRLVSDDRDAHSWNRFGWQRLFMNRLPGKIGQMVGFFIGAVLSTVLSPFERGGMRGSAYTITFKKH